MDIVKPDSETDEELEQRILTFLDPQDRVESLNVLATILNTQEGYNTNYYAGQGGQLQKLMNRMKHEGKVTFLPVQVGRRKTGWYKGSIEVPTYKTTIEFPTFMGTTERNQWESAKFGSKEQARKMLTEEAVKMFGAKNPDTNMYWTLEEIGKAIGGYKPTAVYNWLKNAGVDTLRVKRYSEED